MARNTYNVDESLETPFNIKNFARCKKYVKNSAKNLILGLFLSLTTTVLALLGPLFMKAVIDNIDKQVSVGTKDIKFLVIIGIAYLFCLFLSEFLGYFRTIVVTKAGQQMVHEIRVDIFAHIQKLSFNYFDSRPRGKILVRVVHYVNNVADFLSNGLINFVVQFLNVFIIFFFMLALDVKLTLIVLCGLPIFIGYMFIIKKRQRKAWTNLSAKNSNVTAYVSESINGMQITQAFNREKINLGIFEDLCAQLKKAYVQAIRYSRGVVLVIESMRHLVRAMLYVAAVILFANTEYEAGTVIAMASYAIRFWAPIQALGDIYNQLVNTGSYLERIFDTLDEKVEIEDVEGAYDMPKIKGVVEYDNVTFAYEEGRNILENVSFKAEAGQSFALVGPTGAGKSTVVNLLCRFYDIQGGKITIDGHNVHDVTLASLRSSMGIMLQDSFIFSGTIKDNIRYGKLDATDEEIINAAKTVSAHDFIMELENGYDTEINEKGSMLSQGQRQLICFARTVLSDPAILILDEATSSIDTETEQLVQQGIEKMMQGRTSFVIAHRLSTIINCDKILYIDNKGVAESGSHKELLEKGGLYYDLYTAQLMNSEAEIK
ncbi:MAG: ABC transporter ATP-binding protein [Clostridia bacterium]|nr:ABC transporter ATP-binding protein [Clostridia bacterium]